MVAMMALMERSNYRCRSDKCADDLCSFASSRPYLLSLVVLVSISADSWEYALEAFQYVRVFSLVYIFATVVPRQPCHSLLLTSLAVADYQQNGSLVARGQYRGTLHVRT